MVKCRVSFAVRTELLNNSRVPAVLLRGVTVATWATVATWETMTIVATRGVRVALVTCAIVATWAIWARYVSLYTCVEVRFG
jgi:hypothetical protein